MTVSTLSTVRAVIAGAIEGIYNTLGFESSPGNVKEYLLDEELPENVSSYLLAKLTGHAAPRIRAWAVQVDEYEDYSIAGGSALREVPNRIYDIQVVGYYGAYGSTPVNIMRTDARAVRKAIKDLTLNLSGTVGLLQMRSAPSITKLGDIPEQSVSVYAISIQYQAQKFNADW